MTSAAAEWLDPALPAARRAKALLSALTDEQKIALALSNTSSPSLAGLGIPRQVCSDGPAGVRGADGATAFPVPIALAASFDPQLAYELGAAIAREVRAAGRTTWIGLCADIVRAPLAGRCAEALGEAPLLAARLAGAEVSGARSEHVLTMVKHLTAYNQERWRVGHATGDPGQARDDAIDVLVSERALREIYLPPIAAAVAAGVGAVMGSYNRLNGEYACQNSALLAILKGDFAFRGFVAPDFRHAVRDALTAVNAGLDRPTLDDDSPGELTAAMFEEGEISAERLDDICHRVLYALVDSGLVDHPIGGSTQGRATNRDHQELARRIAVSSTVLLKNDGVLPLDPQRGSLALIGPAGADAIFVVGGSAAVSLAPGQASAPADAIRARAGEAATVVLSQGSLGDAPLPPVAAGFFGSPAGSGLTAHYYSNPHHAGQPALVRIEPTIELAQAPAELGDAWSARWSGRITPPASGMYRISLLVAGGVALYLDGQIVLAGEREAARFIDGPLLPLQAEVELSGERPLELRLDYTAAPAVFPPQLTLGWQTPGGSLIDGATAAAGATDVAVVFVTSAEGEGMDRSSLTLAGDQDRLVRAVAAANPKTVVVVNSGGPVLMPWLDEVAAVLQVWYPGEQYGRALTDVLFGDADPGGRLPVTFPATEQQGPASRAVPRRYPGVDRTVRYDEETLVGYRWFDATGQEPLFPFGFGLSYASIQIEGAQLTTRQDDSLCVAVSLTNHAVRPGTEVVQVYVEPPSGPEPRTRRLAAFAKVDLAASASTSLELEIPRAALATFRTDSGWEVAAGSYAIWAGLSSRDLEECGSLLIERAARCDDPWIAA